MSTANPILGAILHPTERRSWKRLADLGRRAALPIAVSSIAHLALAAGALTVQRQPPPPQEPEPIEVSLMGMMGGPGMGDGGPEEAPAAPAPAPPPPPKAAAPKPPAPPTQPKEVLAVPAKPEAAEPPVDVVPEVVDEAPVVAEAEEVEAPEIDEAVEATESEVSPDAIPGSALLAQAGTGTGTGSGSGGGLGGGFGDGAGFGFGAGGGDEIVDVSQAVTRPRLSRQVTARYPSRAKNRGIEGTVLLHLVLGKDGRVEREHTKVLDSVPALDAAAIEAANRYRFTPALDGAGRPIRVSVKLPISFSLR